VSKLRARTRFSIKEDEAEIVFKYEKETSPHFNMMETRNKDIVFVDQLLLFNCLYGNI